MVNWIKGCKAPILFINDVLLIMNEVIRLSSLVFIGTEVKRENEVLF